MTSNRNSFALGFIIASVVSLPFAAAGPQQDEQDEHGKALKLLAEWDKSRTKLGPCAADVRVSVFDRVWGTPSSVKGKLLVAGPLEWIYKQNRDADSPGWLERDAAFAFTDGGPKIPFFLGAFRQYFGKKDDLCLLCHPVWAMADPIAFIDRFESKSVVYQSEQTMALRLQRAKVTNENGRSIRPRSDALVVIDLSRPLPILLEFETGKECFATMGDCSGTRIRFEVSDEEPIDAILVAQEIARLKLVRSDESVSEEQVQEYQAEKNAAYRKR